jgi:hypothetical protein
LSTALADRYRLEREPGQGDGVHPGERLLRRRTGRSIREGSTRRRVLRASSELVFGENFFQELTSKTKLK